MLLINFLNNYFGDRKYLAERGIFITERQLRKLAKDVAILKANIYKKNYNRTKYRQVSFRFDKNIIDYDKFKNKLKENNLSVSKFFINCIWEYLEN